jgi:OmcA/MtrC family decaheme c-type cytochrome
MATGSLSFTMAGPTTDYGNTNFGSDVTTPGYVTESAAKTSSCGADGTCTYTFTHPVPAGAKGTFAIGVEARLSATLQQGTVNQQSVSYATPNQVIYFSVDGTPVSKRRTVVATANCNSCHAKLELHGSLRNNTEYCVMCHNPGNTDSSMRPSATNAADKAAPAQGINFAMMIHKVHTGTNLEVNFNQDYVIVGYGGSHNSFGATYASVPATVTNTGVRFPAMSPTGNPHDTTNCALCHVNASESNLPVGLNNVTDPQGLITSAPATTSACTACHLNVSAFAHASMNTDPKFGESCSVCHGAGAAYDPAVVHAGQ